MKVDFIDDDHFIIYYLTDDDFRTENEMKSFFKLLNYDLKHRYHYEFHGFYNVNIFCCKGLYVLEFENIDDFGSSDFNITMLLNSTLLYEFEDSELILGEKIYYQGKFYVEAIDMVEDIRFFEFGNVVYGRRVDEILNKGILVTI